MRGCDVAGRDALPAQLAQAKEKRVAPDWNRLRRAKVRHQAVAATPQIVCRFTIGGRRRSRRRLPARQRNHLRRNHLTRPRINDCDSASRTLVHEERGLRNRSTAKRLDCEIYRSRATTEKRTSYCRGGYDSSYSYSEKYTAL